MLVKPERNAEVGVIGGSGLYQVEMLENPQEIKVYTPYGEPSDKIVVGRFKGKTVAFLARHGRGHRIPPHKINYRANLWALKTLGVKRVISVSAVGSMREDYRPGDFVVPDQYIDFTKKRDYSFFEGHVVAHVSMADPFCPELRSLIVKVGGELNIKVHDRGTYICIEGPRFSTRAESRLYKSWGVDVIGMTLVPEVNLAREAQMCYATIAMITDYDVWAEKPVTAEEVLETMRENVEKARRLLYELIPRIPVERKCNCGEALREALI